MIPGNWNQVLRKPSLEGLPPMSLSARMVLAEVAHRCRRSSGEGGRPEWRISLRELSKDLEEPSHTTVSRAVKALQACGVLTYRKGVFRLTRGVSATLKPRSRRRRSEITEETPEEVEDRSHNAPEYCTA